MRIVKFLLSIGLLAIDLGARTGRLLLGSIAPYLPTSARLFAVGALSGGCFVGTLVAVQWTAEFQPQHVDLMAVLMVWGVGNCLWAAAAIMYMILKTSGTLLASMVWRLTDIAAIRQQPVIVERERKTTETKPPAFRDPGKLANETSSFVGYDDEAGYIREAIAEMRTKGISEDDIEDMVKEYERGRTKPE